MKNLRNDLNVPDLHYRLIRERFLRSYIAPKFEQQYQQWFARRMAALPKELELRIKGELEQRNEERYAAENKSKTYFIRANGVLSALVCLIMLFLTR